MDELDAELARRLRATLDDRGMRREDLARGMVELGFRWSGNTVTQVVTGRRGLSLLELAGVCEVLGLHIGGLLDSNSYVVLPSGDEVLVATVLNGLSGGGYWANTLAAKSAILQQQEEIGRLMKLVSEEATQTAAKRLGVAPEEVEAASQRLWGHSLATERDNRVGETSEEGETPDTRRALQARRGHASRALIEELKAYFAEQQR